MFTKLQWNPDDDLDLPKRLISPHFVYINKDLFDSNIPVEFVEHVLAVCALTPRHQYVLKTNFPDRMFEVLSGLNETDNFSEEIERQDGWNDLSWVVKENIWPLPNVHLEYVDTYGGYQDE